MNRRLRFAIKGIRRIRYIAASQWLTGTRAIRNDHRVQQTIRCRSRAARRVSRRAGLPAFVGIETLEELKAPPSASSVLLPSLLLPYRRSPALSTDCRGVHEASESLSDDFEVRKGIRPRRSHRHTGLTRLHSTMATLKGNGAGQTIAIVDAFVDQNIASDLREIRQPIRPGSSGKLHAIRPAGSDHQRGLGLGNVARQAECAYAIALGANICPGRGE